MRSYSNYISLSQNGRGIYSLDPTIGCKSGTETNPRGCYNDCYAARIAKVYGYDFSKTVKRSFKNETHLYEIINSINKIKLPFLRMGTMGDPSEDWEHTINICQKVQNDPRLKLFNNEVKEIVIITKHWSNLTKKQLNRISKLKICINTSISVLDENKLYNNSLKQYERIKPFCRSILRIVSCDFNTENVTGNKLAKKQRRLFNNYKYLDTVFRTSLNNKLVTEGIINIHKTKFLGKKTYVSKVNKKTYFGKCGSCLEMCGVKM